MYAGDDKKDWGHGCTKYVHNYELQTSTLAAYLEIFLARPAPPLAIKDEQLELTLDIDFGKIDTWNPTKLGRRTNENFRDASDMKSK